METDFRTEDRRDSQSYQTSASDAEVLVARRQLETDLTFRGGIQLRYTFGSIYNNVVNSRLSSESGGFSRIF